MNNRNRFLSEINVFRSKSMIPILLTVLFVIIILFTIINPLYLSLFNIQSIIINMVIAGIMAIGLTPLMISGNIDISLGSIMGVTAVVTVYLYRISSYDIPFPLIIIIGISVGAIVGAINGFFVTVVGLNSIITTLGTLSILRGINFLYASATEHYYDEKYLFIGRGFLFDYVPVTLVYMLVILLIIFVVLKYTKFGRHIFAIGGNAYVSKLYGINVKRVKFLTFVIAGITASISGIILSSQLGQVSSATGTGYEFRVITICVLGGISPSGGKGSLIGVFIASLIIGAITNGLGITNTSIEWREAISGLLLIAVIVFDSVRNKQRSLLT